MPYMRRYGLITECKMSPSKRYGLIDECEQNKKKLQEKVDSMNSFEFALD